MREIFEGSKRTIKSWNRTLIAFLVMFFSVIVLFARFSTFGGDSGLTNSDSSIPLPSLIDMLLLIIVFISSIVTFIFWLIGFIRGINMYLLIKNKCEWMEFAGGEGEREKFSDLSAAKNTLLIALIFDFLFFLISLFFKHSFKKKIREMERKENQWSYAE